MWRCYKWIICRGWLYWTFRVTIYWPYPVVECSRLLVWALVSMLYKLLPCCLLTAVNCTDYDWGNHMCLLKLRLLSYFSSMLAFVIGCEIGNYCSDIGWFYGLMLFGNGRSRLSLWQISCFVVFDHGLLKWCAGVEFISISASALLHDPF